MYFQDFLKTIKPIRSYCNKIYKDSNFKEYLNPSALVLRSSHNKIEMTGSC